MKQDVADKPKVMAAQRKLLESRYNLTPQLDPEAKMSRGKPLPVGPTARLTDGRDVGPPGRRCRRRRSRRQSAFPYPPLPHPQARDRRAGVPAVQIAMFPRLERFDVDFDLPEAFIPEFPPAIFLQNRPELGDVSRGEVVSINNFHRLFKDILTPVQLDGLRLLLTPLPQEEFNPTDDRKTAQPSLGVTCLDCHVNGHTTGQFHLNPDDPPAAAPLPARHDEPARRVQAADPRVQAEPAVGRGLHRVRAAHGLLQRRPDPRVEEGHDDPRPRSSVSHMAQLQNMLDFPPAPEARPPTGRLDPTKATESELRGEKLFFGKAQCADVPPGAVLPRPPDARPAARAVPRTSRATGRSRRSRCAASRTARRTCTTAVLTLEDTVEFFNLVLGLKLNAQEKADLVAFMRQL